jgi:hypothetical protein
MDPWCSHYVTRFRVPLRYLRGPQVGNHCTRRWTKSSSQECRTLLNRYSRSVSIVCSQTQATECSFLVLETFGYGCWPVTGPCEYSTEGRREEFIDQVDDC